MASHVPTMASDAGVIDAAKAAVGGALVEAREAAGEVTLVVKRDAIADVLRALRDTPGLEYQQLMEIAGVDYPERPERFEVVYHLLSLTRNHRIRVRVSAPNGDQPIWAFAEADPAEPERAKRVAQPCVDGEGAVGDSPRQLVFGDDEGREVLRQASVAVRVVDENVMQRRPVLARRPAAPVAHRLLLELLQRAQREVEDLDRVPATQRSEAVADDGPVLVCSAPSFGTTAPAFRRSTWLGTKSPSRYLPHACSDRSTLTRSSLLAPGSGG